MSQRAFSLLRRPATSLPNRCCANARAYATRRPEKPPARFPDPLTSSSNAELEKLPDGVTFFRRPPPSAPSPLSTTVSPASPLLRPQAPSMSSNSPASPLAPSGNEATSTPVPPRLRTPRVFPTNRVLSESDFARMRELRAQDPEKYTRGRLAKMFNCPPFLVGQQVPLSTPARRTAIEKLDRAHEEVRNAWGERKRLVMAIRKKRREFW